MKQNNRAVGKQYEMMAGRILEKLGYQILERNYYCPKGEVDLIAVEQETLVFIEVKYRSGRQQGLPEEAVNSRKQQKLCRCADWYLMCDPYCRWSSFRFDVIAMNSTQYRLYKNAFFYDR